MTTLSLENAGADTASGTTDSADSTPAADTLFKFNLPGVEPEIGVDKAKLPAKTNDYLIETAARTYIANAANGASQKYKKADAPWIAYEEAVAKDPLQTAVAKPEGDRPTAPNLIEVVKAARDRLYSGEMRIAGESGKEPTTKDPLDKQVTSVVQREVFDKRRKTDPKFSWPQVVKEVGASGIAYLKAAIAEKVSAAPEGERDGIQKALDKYLEEKYLKPARIMLGMDTPKSVVGDGIL